MNLITLLFPVIITNSINKKGVSAKLTPLLIQFLYILIEKWVSFT